MSYLNNSEGRNIYYELVDGDNNKPYLVFLHEGLGCIKMWKDFPQKLCIQTGCPGILYDRTGYGNSSPEQKPREIDYLYDYALKELPDVLKALIPNAPYILIGHSDGASIALISGSKKDSLLKGIITEAAHVFVEEETISGIRVAEIAFNNDGSTGLQKYHGKKTSQMFKAWSETWLSDQFRSWNIETLLPDITCPVLALQGDQDKYGTKKQLESIGSQVSGSVKEHMILDCGHAPHLEKPELVLNLISIFIREVTS